VNKKKKLCHCESTAARSFASIPLSIEARGRRMERQRAAGKCVTFYKKHQQSEILREFERALACEQ
jgi:hypothetical protein